jgi:hypothetical protein
MAVMNAKFSTSYNKLSLYEQTYISTYDFELIRNFVPDMMWVEVILHCSMESENKTSEK